jgi:rubrerythrin
MMDDISLHKGLKLAVKTEQMGAQFYAKTAAKFPDNADIADIFTQLSKDEQVHEVQFRKILEAAPPEEEGAGNYEVDQYTRAIAISEFFRTEEMKTMGEVNSPEEALGKALSFEKSTLLFYLSLKELLGENGPLDEIIKAEKEHITRLARIIVTDAKFRGIRDNW